MPRVTFRLLLAAAAFAFITTAAGAVSSDSVQPPQGAPPVHPPVDQAQDCETCHKERTPAVFERWEKSPHGLNSVKCFVCHGTVNDKSFTTRPQMSKCESCHSEQIETMSAPLMKGKTCFTCHDPHALNPHMAAQGGSR